MQQYPYQTAEAVPTEYTDSSEFDNRNECWCQGHFICTAQPEYKKWTSEAVRTAEKDENFKVRPYPLGNAICFCTTPDAAKWIADRLNLAAKLEKEIERITPYKKLSEEFYIVEAADIIRAEQAGKDVITDGDHCCYNVCAMDPSGKTFILGHVSFEASCNHSRDKFTDMVESIKWRSVGLKFKI